MGTVDRHFHSERGPAGTAVVADATSLSLLELGRVANDAIAPVDLGSANRRFNHAHHGPFSERLVTTVVARHPTDAYRATHRALVGIHDNCRDLVANTIERFVQHTLSFGIGNAPKQVELIAMCTNWNCSSNIVIE
ncbi:MAG: hypothetical protein QM784_25565 [Polyangiaceae bacterium]